MVSFNIKSKTIKKSNMDSAPEDTRLTWIHSMCTWFAAWEYKCEIHLSFEKNVFKMQNKKQQSNLFSEAVSKEGDAVFNHTVLCYPVSKVLWELVHMGKTGNVWSYI